MDAFHSYARLFSRDLNDIITHMGFQSWVVVMVIALIAGYFFLKGNAI